MASLTTSTSLSLTEKLTLILRLAFLGPPQLLFEVTRCLTLAAIRGAPLRHYVHSAWNRFALGRLSARQLQFLTAPTSTTYQTWIPSRKAQALKSPSPVAHYTASRLQHTVDPLPDGASSLLWVGDCARATKVVYFLHGGGYAAPLLPGHLEWCLRAYVLAGAAHPGEEVAVAVLQYTLCPPAQYPSQLKQAVAGLAHLLKSGVRPRDLVLGGDSAGGNLTAAVLGHLLHPHPEAVEVVLAEPLAGAFLVSPWVSAGTKGRSFEENQYIDMLSPAMVGKTTAGFVAGVLSYEVQSREGKLWAMPVDGDAEAWFAGLDKIVNAVYVTVGGQEILLDQGVELAEAIRRGNPGVDVRLELAKNEAHDFILLEGAAQRDGDAMTRMKAWVSTVFWG
ncbi:Alpha/Beta hydrolase protein [Lasiosphaeria hispida]|uniref:Alpha/Beta hydrolase protein n=1 Tax=Lasiosphaeria hispida TaxID=260671 RepID=A0AAJ0MBK7_9PEZI|nr:Alpha/Beta hydrolase protein [Lasiosphaeria hispida]